MNRGLQSHTLKKRFNRLNPEVGDDMIDWSVLGDGENFHENAEMLKKEYPQYEWDGVKDDPYYFQATQNLREQAKEYGFEVLTKTELNRLVRDARTPKKRDKTEVAQVNLDEVKKESEPIKTVTPPNSVDIYYLLAQELKRYTVAVVAAKRHGKSTSVKTLLSKTQGFHWKIFDVSLSWFHCAPVKWRQRIHRGKTTEFKNIPDCVYEIGNLDEDTRREVVAQIIREDYDSRYFGKLIEGPQVIDQVPWICYVFEECETYFDSRSLNKKDRAAEVFRDFIKVGSNYGLTGLMVVQVMTGELATKIRKRSGLLLGQIQGSEELREIRNRTNRETAEIVKKIDRFNWVYWNGWLSEPFRIPDVVRNTPQDYKGALVEVQNR